jgi:hypothetical protein
MQSALYNWRKSKNLIRRITYQIEHPSHYFLNREKGLFHSYCSGASISHICLYESAHEFMVSRLGFSSILLFFRVKLL